MSSQFSAKAAIAAYKLENPAFADVCSKASSYKTKQAAIAAIVFLAFGGLVLGATVSLWKHSMAGAIASGVFALPAFVVFVNASMNFSASKAGFKESPAGIALAKMKAAESGAEFALARPMADYYATVDGVFVTGTER